MGRTGTGLTIHPTLPSFDLSPMALLQLTTKSQADLKKNIINFYKGISPLSVPCFQLCQRNDNLWASSAIIFLCYSEVTVMMRDIYLPHREFTGLGCGCWAPVWASSSHRVGMVPVHRISGARQAAGRASRKSVGGQRTSTAMENGAYGV